MNKLNVLTMAVAAAMFLSPAAGFAEKGEHKDSAKWEAKKKFYKELGLNEDQKKALQENKEKHRKEKKELFESMRDKMKAMHEELGKEKLDMAKINQIQDELKALQSKMIDQRLAHILEVRSILTPEQFKKFSEKMKDRKHHGGHWGKKDKEGHEDHEGPKGPEAAEDEPRD